MCGIAGILLEGREGGESEDLAGVRRMMSAQAHRGPDSAGLYQNAHVILGHRRLSIIDLSGAGAQPMSNEDGTIWAIHNGEIYNFRNLSDELRASGHRFKSKSDTEVLIHGYEEWDTEGLLERLRGMYAFALFDQRRLPPKLILARDRFGIKPLYYVHFPERHQLIFASEVRALCQSGLFAREEEPRAWLAFLLFGSVPVPWTTVKGIQALPPAHYIVADASGVRLREYYSVAKLFGSATPFVDTYRECGHRLQDLENKIHDILDEAVGLHLISDAPLGVFLSGGIDSSALVALAASRDQELVTLSVVFDEEGFSEKAYQEAVARRFGTRHVSIRVTQRDFQEEMEQFLKCMDQPTVDGLNTYFVARAAREAGLKVVLSGIGGDEVFCGYATLRRARALWQLRRLPAPLKSATLAIGNLLPSLKKLAFLDQSGYLGFYLVQRGLFTPREAAELLGAEERQAWELIKSLEPPEAPEAPIVLQQFLEARHYLVDQLLKDADVFGMAHSLELRVPFLDHFLVETVLRAPPHWRLDRHWPKPLLTRPLRNILPREVVFRPKQGFNLPAEIWLRSTYTPSKNGSSVLDAASSQAVSEAFLSGQAHWSRLWALLVLGRLWK